MLTQTWIPLSPLICRDFHRWEFPHDNFPKAWQTEPHDDPTLANWPTEGSAISQKVKDRDGACLVSGWMDSLTTSHVVPKSEETWLIRNKMVAFAYGDPPVHLDPYNLFTLRWDLHLGQFDQGRFVIVPKSGQLVVHFLQPGTDSVQHYHNTPFNHQNFLSHELLYARFAWALMKTVNEMELDVYFLGTSEEETPEQSDIEGMSDGSGGGSEGDGGGGRGGRGGRGEGGGGGRGGGGSGGGGEGSRKHKPDEDDGSGPDPYTRSSENLRSRKRVKSDACPREDGTQFLDRETQELEEDMKLAARTLPFFVDPNREADPGYYEDIVWYPGKAAVERQKQAYFDSHPQIRAHSGPLLPDDYNSSDDEN